MFGLRKKQKRLSFNDPRCLIGKTGIVSIEIAPRKKGQIYIFGTWYLAQCNQDIILPKDLTVEVVDIESNTVYVKPL